MGTLNDEEKRILQWINYYLLEYQKELKSYQSNQAGMNKSSAFMTHQTKRSGEDDLHMDALRAFFNKYSGDGSASKKSNQFAGDFNQLITEMQNAHQIISPLIAIPAAVAAIGLGFLGFYLLAAVSVGVAALCLISGVAVAGSLIDKAFGSNNCLVAAQLKAIKQAEEPEITATSAPVPAI